MTRIKTGSTVRGRPGFKTKGATISQNGGGLVNRTKAGVKGVTRLFARDPASANALIGTSKDVNFLTEDVNTVAQQNPRIIRQPHAGSGVKGTENVVDRSSNRRVRKLK